MEDKLYKAWLSAGKYYDLPDYDTFKEDMKDEGKLHRFHESLGKYYDVPDYDTFKADMWGTAAQQQPTGQTGAVPAGQTTSAGEMVAQNGAVAGAMAGGVQTYKPAKPGDKQDIAVYNREGDMVRSDTATNLGGGKVGVVQVESPYSRGGGQTPEERAIQERISQVGEIYMEPESYSMEPDAADGKMHYSWRNGRRIGQLDPGALRFAHIGRDYSSDAYRQAEKDAAGMTDAQLKDAFERLYSMYSDGDDALIQGYGRDDASRMMAYATEMRYRDIGMGHAADYGGDGQQNQTGVYHYHAARMNPAVSSEMDAQDRMGWDKRLSYLSEVLRDKKARENSVNAGVGTDEDRKALDEDRRKLLAGVMLYARDNHIYPEDAYSIVIGAANNAIPKDYGFWAGLTSTTSQMWRDAKYFLGEAANLVANDRGDVLDAMSALDKYGDEAETKLVAGMLHNMGLLGMMIFDGDEAGAAEGAHRMLSECIVNGKDGRIDVDATRAALQRKLQTTYSWGDRTMRDNIYNTAMARQAEGDAAWWGQQVAQLVPTTAAIIVGVTTRNPVLAETIGQLGMGYMCISSGSQAMQEARMYGADDNQVWTAGIVNAALEYLTEKIPFDRYTKRVFGEVKATATRKLMDAVVDVNNPAHHEIQQLLESAVKELGANKGKIAKAYTGDLLAEGSSEFVAGVLQKASEIMYKNPEDYPTFMEILDDGVEGFKGGAAMGGIMSSVSNSATYAQADSRRRKAGVVSVGIYAGEDGMGVPVEIIDHDSAGNYIVLDGQHNELIVAPGKLTGVTTYTYDEWKRGEVQQQEDKAQSSGYNAQGEEREQVQDDLQSAEQRLTDMGFDMSTFEGWTGDSFEEAIKGQEGNYSDEELTAIREYFMAKAASDGLQQRVDDDIDTQVQQASEMVDRQTNQGTGMVHRATLNNGQEVYVTGGQLVMTGDGTMVDTEASDESLFVYNPATGEAEQYTPSDFQSVDDPVSPEQLKSEAARDIRQAVERQAEADMNGYVQQGGTYDMVDEQGNTMHGTVVELRPDNTALVQVDGEQIPLAVPTQQLQTWVDNAKQARMSVAPATLPQRGAGVRDNTAAATTGRVVNATDGTPVAPAVPAAPAVQTPALPVDEKTGEPVWNETTPEQGYNHLAQSGLTGEDIGTMIDDRIAQADAAIEKASHGGTIDQRLQARQAKDYWENVKQLHEAAKTAALQRPTGQADTNGRGATAAQGTGATAPAGTVRVQAGQAETMPVGSIAVNPDGTRADDRGQLGIRREDTEYFLRTMSPRMMGLLDKVAKSLGWKIRLYNGENANERGHYDNNVVWVNRRAMTSKLAQWILGHEMTHGMAGRTGRGETFQDYVDLANKLVRNRLGDEAYEKYIKDLINAYKEHLKKLNMSTDKVNRAYIEEEIACDVTGDLLMNNPEMIGKLFSGVDDPGRVKRIIDMIVDALDWVMQKLPFRSKERKALGDLSERLNNLYRDAKAQTDIAKATAREEGSQIESGDGERGGSSFSITGNAEGSGFTCSETVLEIWRVPQEDGTYKEEEHWVKKPLLDSEGNVVFRMGDKEFSAKNPITVDDLKSNPDTVLNYMLADALNAKTIDETKADQVRQQYADMLNLYLEKGVADENGNGFENLEKKWLWVGETVFRTVASNSDEQYSYSIDITKVCKKNEAVIRAISALQVKNGYGVTPAQILEIYEATDAEGFQVPCPVCYVFSRYINNGKYATAIVNGMQKFGKHLPGQSEEWTVEQWVDAMNKAKDQADKMETVLKHANEDVKIILQQIDTLCREITSGKLSAEEAESKRRHVRALDQRYRAALDVISQEAIPRFIKSFVLEGSDQSGWRMREDAALPEDMDDFISHALDIRKTASAMDKYPAITRYRRAGGSAGGKEITFASNNELGTIIMGLGISKGNLDDYPNYYQFAAEAATDEERQALLKKARERFENAMLYVQRQTLRGGQRMWSWSDNIESLSSDVASNLMQLELLGGALQTYSKQLEGVKMVAAMNGYVNASLMGYGDGIREVGPDEIENGRLKDDIWDVNNKGRRRIIANAGSPVYHNEADGKDYVLVFDDVVGIDPFGHEDENGVFKRGLFSLNEEYDRAGNILVGMNDIHVRAAMADPRVFFIIPWHASGMHNHILRQMFNILGVNMDQFVSTDYTNMQEETNFLKLTEKGKLKYTVSADVEAFWDSHSFEDEFACGTGHIENGDHQGGLSDSQRHYRELRDAIFDGTAKDSKEMMDEIMADEFLSQVYRQVTTHVADGKMTEKDKEFIYPYEYWDETKGLKDADVNGRRYLEYCRRMGFKPKFTGKYDKKTGTLSPEGNFADDPGYWKLLIDRRMYDRRGNYQGLTAVDSSGLDSSMYDPDQTQDEFNVTEVATNEGAEKIADMVNQRDTERTGTSPAPNLDMEMDEAVAKYNDVTALQASLIKAEKKAIETAEVAKQRLEKAKEKEAADVDGRKAKSVARAKESARKAMEAAKQAAREVEEIAGKFGTVRVDNAQYGTTPTSEARFSLNMGDAAELGDAGMRFSIRTKPAPKKTLPVYKLMRLGDDGKLYPLYIDGAVPIEPGQWYDADSPNMEMLVNLPAGVHLINPETGEATSLEDYNKQRGITKKSKYPSAEAVNEATANGMRWVYIEPTKGGQRRFGGEARRYWNLGINGSGTVSTYSMRPGWHAGSLPTMRQIGKGPGRNLRDDRFVWVEGEISADVDYNEEAQGNPDNDIPTHIPIDGFYLKATNANAKASQADRVGWYISGAFKANRIMSDSEARDVIDAWNADQKHKDLQVEYDFPRESGKVFNAETMQLEDDDNGPDGPNGGKRFSIDDAAYAEAVEAGDRKKVARMVKDAVKDAMPNTKAVDRWGKPRLLYHGTPQENQFYEFNGTIYLSSNRSVANEYTHYRRTFGANPRQTGRIMPVFVNLENPLEIDANRHLWRNIDVEWSDTPVTTRDIEQYAKDNGYDGVIIKRVRDNMYDNDTTAADVYIAFSPEQVKSAGPTYEQKKRSHFPWDDYMELDGEVGATYDDDGNLIPLSERFDMGKTDIRYSLDSAVAEAEQMTETNPTDGQKESGNYKKGHVKVDGFDISIEQPKGSVRSGVDADGNEWSQEMHNTYGYIRGTEGVDGDHIDVFLSDHLDDWNGNVYVVDQVNKDRSFDEHKVMYGFNSEQEARDAYLSNYEEGWTGLGNITGVSREEFKKWVDSSHRKNKPFAEYKNVKPLQSTGTGDRARFSISERTDDNGNEVYTETREDGTKDREVVTMPDGSRDVTWFDEAGRKKEVLSYYPNGEVRQVNNYDSEGDLTRLIQYDENRRAIRHWEPRIGTDWERDDNGVARGMSNGVEIRPYGERFSLSQRERDYTANVLKKLRGAGVNVQMATDEEARRVLDAAEQADAELMRGWHGSHANFDAFDHSHMGEGEGAQAYGWGTYITEVEGIARKYASAKPDAATIIKVSNGQRTVRVMEDLVNGMKKDLDENTRNLQNTKKWIDEAKKELADIIKQYGQDSFEFSDWHRQRDMQMEAWQDDANSYKRAIKSIKSRLPKYEEKLEEARELLKKIEDELNRPGGRFLYEITIPENDGTNYLPYNGQLSEETTDKLINAIKENLDKTKRDKATYEAEISALRDPAQQKFGDDWLKSLSNEDHARFNDLIEKQYVAIQREAHLKSALIKADMGDEFRYIQDQLEMAFGAKETSEFLSDLGFVGIEYPAMFRSGGRQDDAKNYVIFNEDDAQIINKTEFLKTSDGTVYGWHDNDGIHLTAAGLNPNTPMHEYTHGLMAMLKEREPKRYQQIVEALKDSDVWQDVLNDELYSNIRDDVDAVASEVASRLSGRESEGRANESMPARIKRAIQELWEAVAEWFGVKSPMTADRIARMTLRELERGTNPDGDRPGGGGTERGTTAQYQTTPSGNIRFSLSEDTQKIFDTAKRKFGETKDICEAGYVLPDGTMLDFSGRHELDPGTDSSFLAGRRTTDHRAVNQISFVYDEKGDEVDTGVNSDMPDFIKRGAIRIDNNAGLINLSTAPTSAQKKVLRQLIAENGGDVQVDFGDGWDSDHYVEYDQAKSTRVLGDIDRYFDEGIKPQSNVRFSLSGDGTVEAYNKAVNMTGRTVNVLGRERKPGLTRYNFQEAFQDAILSVKKLQQVVERHFGIKLPTRENAWMYENRLSSINGNERDVFFDKVYNPMMKIADRILKRGVKEKELNAYLICKHGLERNQVFAARDAQAEADEIVRNGGTPDMQQLLDKYRQRDYSGLTGVTGIEGDITDIEAEAQRIVDEFEQKHGQLCNELWDAIRKATQWSLRKSYQSGMMSAATFNHVSSMFHYYIPLRGWSETTAEDVYSYMMGEHGAFNGVLKKAEGRTSVADDPLATIGNMAESALMQGNKNLLKQHLLRMAQNHPTDVCQVRDVWLVEGPGGVWEPHWPNIPEDATPDEIDQILQDHEADMLQLEAGGGAKRVRNNLDIPYRIDPRHVPEHAVVAKVAGVDHVVYINGNPRAAQAINGQTGAGRGTKSGFSRLIDFIFGDLKRYYSSVLTSLNINFSGANFVRDLPHAYAMTFVKYGPLKAAEYIGRSFQVIPWVFKNQLGKTGTGKIDRYFQEFLSSGAVTGYAHINDVDAWKADNKRRFARLSALGKAKVAVPRALGEVINAIGWFSETLELIPRFTAFLVEREGGKDIATATKAAKDITTNFNKKGSEVTPGVWGAVANTLRYMKMFFNPIVQGMYQFVDVAGQAKENKWVGPRMALATMHLPVLGAIVPYLNQFLLEALGGDDDDDYWLLNEYTRRNNVCIFTGNGYLKIPIAPVFRELYGMGEVVATRHSGKADNEKTVIDLIDQLRTMGSVEGQSSYNEWSLARFLLPEHFAPLIDVMNNENFTGGPIYYDNNYKEYAPEYTKAKKSTWSPLVAASKWLNEMMGGDEDIAAGNSGKWMNPAVWQHVITNVGGGFAQLAGDVVSGITDIAEGKEIDASNMPVLKRFYSNSNDERANWSRFGIYKDYEKDYTMAKEKYQALDKRGLSLADRAAEVAKFAESHPKAAAIYAVWEGGIKGADIPGRLEKMGKDDPEYWNLVKEAVDKAEKAMNTGYVRAWEQKRKDRPDSMSDKELNKRFDGSDNDSIRHIMADEISKRAGSQDFRGRDPQDDWGDKSVAAWEAYQSQRTGDDIKADAELSNLLKVDEGEKDKERIKMLKAIKDELNKIRRGKDATSRSAGVKGLGEGDDERVMNELRAARKQLIEDLKNGNAEQAYRNLERRTMRLGLRKKAKEL